MSSRRPRKSLGDISTRVGRAAATSIILEALVTPKPGNVHRLSDLPGLTLEDLAASAIISYRHFVEAAQIGLKLFFSHSYVEGSLGGIVKSCVLESVSFLGTNVNLGTALTLALQSASSAYVLAERGGFHVDSMVHVAYRLAHMAGPLDSRLYLEAVRLASPSYLGRLDFWGIPDVHDPLLADKLERRDIRLRDLLATVGSDIVSKNFSSGLMLTRGYYLEFKRELKSLGWDLALLRTFARIILENGDYLVLRKRGVDALHDMARLLKRVLECRGKREMLESMFSLDREFRAKGYTPGSSADIVASIIMCSLLEDSSCPWRSRRDYYWYVPSPEDDKWDCG